MIAQSAKTKISRRNNRVLVFVRVSSLGHAIEAWNLAQAIFRNDPAC
jgi:hypothetical protein